MNIVKIVKQIFAKSIKNKSKIELVQQHIGKDLLHDDIEVSDIYNIIDFSKQQLNQESEIINLTEKQLPQKILTFINKIKLQFQNIQKFIVYDYINNDNIRKFIIDFILVNGDNSGHNHQMQKSIEQIYKLITFIDNQQYDENDNLFLSIRSYDGDIIDNIYYYLLQFYI